MAERLGNKLVVHDYGHGGGGISLSWGTVQLAVGMVDEDVREGPRRATVLGCGVVGLSTARLLQRRGWQVTIYAKDLPPQTTSNVAVGQWAPSSVFDPEDVAPAFLDQFKHASRLALREFQHLLGPEYGVHWLDNYYLSEEPPPPPNPMGLFQLLPDLFANGAFLRSSNTTSTRLARRPASASP